MAGWVKIHRDLLDWEWYDDINTMRLWFHLLLTVNYEDKKWRGMVIKRGQKVTSYANLSEETGLSVRSIRTCLERLKSTGELTIKTTNKNTVLTVVKYALYQDNDSKTTNKTTSHSTIKRQSNDNQTTTTKESKEEKKKKEKKEMSLPLEEGPFFFWDTRNWPTWGLKPEQDELWWTYMEAVFPKYMGQDPGRLNTWRRIFIKFTTDYYAQVNS